MKSVGQVLRTLGVTCLIAAQAWLPIPVVAQTQRGDDSAAPVGLVNSVSGEVFARRPSGEEALLKPGDVFAPGTTFRTGADGNLVLLFADGQNVTLGNDSSLRVDEYRFDLRNPKAGRSTISVLAGSMSLVSGAIHTGNPQGLNVNMGEVRIGIASNDVTAFTVQAGATPADPGFVAVTIGEVTLRTASGSVAVSSEQFTRVQSGNAPSQPVPLAAAPAALQALVAGSNATVIGSNNPIDVQSTAVQVALAALPATSAGNANPDNQPTLPVQSANAVIPSVTPGGGRGCVGSPC